MFIDVFPQYLAMGMSYDEFWHGKPSLVRAYRKAWQLRRENRNSEAWLMGLYVYDALMCVAPVMRAALSNERPKPGKYPEEPYPLTEKEAKRREAIQERKDFEAYLAKMNAASERELKRRAEGTKKEAKTDG